MGTLLMHIYYRRKRRGTRARRGVILPDREPQKTHRTGFAVAPEQELTDEQFMNSQLYDQINGGNGGGMVHSKRSAALKARMNIAAEAADTGDELLQGGSVNRVNTMPVGIALGNSLNKFQSVGEQQRYIRQQNMQQQAWKSMNQPSYR